MRKTLLCALAVALFLAPLPGAAEYIQGQTNAVVYCPGVQDTSPFDAITTGTVMQGAITQIGGTNDGYYWNAATPAWQVAQVYNTLTHDGDGLWVVSNLSVPSDAAALKIACRASDSSAQVVLYTRQVHPVGTAATEKKIKGLRR